MSIDEDLRKMPVRRWQCSEGCVHLVRRSGRDDKTYDCLFWQSVPKTLSAVPTRREPCGMIPAKRINGPHTDQPTLKCPHFTKSS